MSDGPWELMDKAQKAGKLVEYARLALKSSKLEAIKAGPWCSCGWCRASELERKMALALAKEQP